jgi:NADH-quinone oxidoreductase subunit A
MTFYLIEKDLISILDFLFFILFQNQLKTFFYCTTVKTSSALLSSLYPICVAFIFSCILSVIIFILSYVLVYQKPETEKLSTYECGFEPYDDARQPFDVKFYLVAILFLIFDIETVFLFPWSITISLIDVVGFWVFIDFVLELGIGFLYLWYINALEW